MRTLACRIEPTQEGMHAHAPAHVSRRQEEELAKSTVRKVVQKTFAKDVEQADADVLLELHTDWVRGAHI